MEMHKYIRMITCLRYFSHTECCGKGASAHLEIFGSIGRPCGQVSLSVILKPDVFCIALIAKQQDGAASMIQTYAFLLRATVNSVRVVAHMCFKRRNMEMGENAPVVIAAEVQTI